MAKRPLGERMSSQGNQREERVSVQEWGFSQGTLLICSERDTQLPREGQKMNIAPGIARTLVHLEIPLRELPACWGLPAPGLAKVV